MPRCEYFSAFDWDTSTAFIYQLNRDIFQVQSRSLKQLFSVSLKLDLIIFAFIFS